MTVTVSSTSFRTSSRFPLARAEDTALTSFADRNTFGGLSPRVSWRFIQYSLSSDGFFSKTRFENSCVLGDRQIVHIP